MLLVATVARPVAAQSLVRGRSLATAAAADAVQQRGRSQYDAIGIGLGGFRLLPTLRARLTYDDNIFNSGSGRVDDASLFLRPAASLVSGWSRHSLAVNADAAIERYAKTRIADATQYSVAAAGRYDISRSAAFGLSARRARAVEARGSLGDIAIGGEPSRYDDTAATATATLLLANVGLTATAGIGDLDYKSVRVNGTEFTQDFRDRRQRDLGLRADVTAGPGLRLFTSGAWNDQRYRRRSAAINQDSSGYNLLGGIAFGVTELISGEVGFGYIRQKYDDAALGTVSGLSYTARATWNPTRLTTVTLRAAKTIQQNPFASQSGIAQDQVELGIDHELLRNLIVSASASMVRDRYRELGRTDRRYATTLAGRLLLNRNMEVELSANHRRQESTGIAARPFSGSSLAVSLVLKK